MSRKIALVLLSLFFTISLFAAVIPGEDDSSVPQDIRNNEFFLESLRLTKLAHDTFEFGDYDASAGFAEEAIRYAQLSDEHVAVQLIDEAKRLLDWANVNNIVGQYPNDYEESKNYYDTAVVAYSNEEWTKSIDAAIKSIEILAALEAEANRVLPLPGQYTVRSWAGEKDCLWNIAGYPWIYGEPRRWRDLYEANRPRMPDPNNPNLIEPGMVLDIPSIRGEVRQGMWDPNRIYTTP
jgi:hypothetical protein